MCDFRGARCSIYLDSTNIKKTIEEKSRKLKALPDSLWSTYSAYANCYGGVIILSVAENEDGSWQTTGLQDENKLRRDFWNMINNRQKVSISLLSDSAVQTYQMNQDTIMVIYVPAAKREQKPVYFNDDLFGEPSEETGKAIIIVRLVK